MLRGDNKSVMELQELTGEAPSVLNGSLVLRKALQRAGEELGL